MKAYLDNSATTRCLPEVSEIVMKTMMEDYGNPSSRHMKGVQAERYLKDSRERISKTLKVSEKEIFFTSGGTESNNWAVIGCAMANKRAGNHLITTAVEHPAVLQPMQYLEEQGFRVSYIKTDRWGKVDLEALKESICLDTILISAMYVNNEVGALEPIEEIAKIIQDKKPDILFHVDAIQAYGKYRIWPKKQGIDLLSVSGHKIHGPKGIGFLYINEKVKIKPLLLGGGQQRGMRSGTDNVPGAAGLGAAASKAYENFEENLKYLYEIKSFFMEGLQKIPQVTINSREGILGAPQIVSASFRGIRSEVLLHALEDKEIYISSGSACSSNKKLPVSTVLREIGVEKDLLESTVRFSFSIYTTKEEICYCLQELEKIVPVLRKYSRH